ncbi:hypothetical protein ACIRRA_11335 [Nocardia sp. NPDC101769]|uniref:hypothetical protein n=1 Tax=Nocardia sp. NPDC101769 TaxID=3364333 RepID=UPI003824D589
MGIIGREVRLSSFHVQWSPTEEVYIARSDRHPSLAARDEWSSLAAVDTLMDLIERQGRHDDWSGRPAA